MKERSKARAWALRVLYAWESRDGADLVQVLDEFMTRRVIAPARREYLRRLVTAVARHQAGIDDALRGAISNWRLGRLSVIDRNILRLAAAEMLHFDEVPPKVSIGEALKLAERYGTDESPRFVNGVLDALMKAVDRA